jgi:hypothetical protein
MVEPIAVAHVDALENLPVRVTIRWWAESVPAGMTPVSPAASRRSISFMIVLWAVTSGIPSRPIRRRILRVCKVRATWCSSASVTPASGCCDRVAIWTWLS